MRGLAILLLLAVLPSVELAEQLAHVIEHVAHGETPSHSAHHDAEPGDEHGCTGLVHLCATNHSQVTTQAVVAMTTVETIAVIAVALPPPLADKNALEPPQRPPIG
ncbi:MAG: hypothetical protein M4D80_12290 [Myxococcota bacterium]|nr:hypothetical protein [Myxococcota bacterium]